MLLERARFGRSVLDLVVKSAPDRVTLRVRVRLGPALPMVVAFRLAGVGHLLVDEQATAGDVAAFLAVAEHEVQFLTGGG